MRTTSHFAAMIVAAGEEATLWESRGFVDDASSAKLRVACANTSWGMWQRRGLLSSGSWNMRRPQKLCTVSKQAPFCARGSYDSGDWRTHRV